MRCPPPPQRTDRGESALKHSIPLVLFWDSRKAPKALLRGRFMQFKAATSKGSLASAKRVIFSLRRLIVAMACCADINRYTPIGCCG